MPQWRRAIVCTITNDLIDHPFSSLYDKYMIFFWKTACRRCIKRMALIGFCWRRRRWRRRDIWRRLDKTEPILWLKERHCRKLVGQTSRGHYSCHPYPQSTIPHALYPDHSKFSVTGRKLDILKYNSQIGEKKLLTQSEYGYSMLANQLIMIMWDRFRAILL